MATIWCLTENRYLDQRMPGAALTWLEAHGYDVRVVVADRRTSRISRGRTSSPWDGLADGDVVVSRARHPLALALLDAASRRRVDVVTPWTGVEAVRNKARCADLLSWHGLPTPDTVIAADLAGLACLDPADYPLVLKPHLGDNATGLVVVRTPQELASAVWADDVALAQRWVETGGWDVKLYVCGERVWAVRRPSPLDGGGAPAGTAEPVAVTAELRWIARTCSVAFDLPLCGVDVVESPGGPLVVDVNDFPNYTGVDEAPAAVGTLLVERLDRPNRVREGADLCAS